MALLGSFIDVRTIASFASNASASFAHGLPAAPDFIIIAGAGAASTASGVLPLATSDAPTCRCSAQVDNRARSFA